MPGLQARRGLTSDPVAPDIEVRLAALDWAEIASSLDESGFATTGPLLTTGECEELSATWGETGRFRSRVDMARHRFGIGEYRYYAEPLPPVVAALRRGVYPRLVPVANRWMERLRLAPRYPDDFEAFRAFCAQHGQRRPTPLLLRYAAGGFNCLHQDLYGVVAFPMQLTCLLSEPGRAFQGGEFLLVEQRPRQQSRGLVVPLRRGEAVIFGTRHRPVAGARGDHRATLRHGVSRIAAGERWSLGVIFHDAE